MPGSLFHEKVPGHVRVHEMVYQFMEEKKVVLTIHGKRSIRESITKRSPTFFKAKNLFKAEGGWIGGEHQIDDLFHLMFEFWTRHMRE